MKPARASAPQARAAAAAACVLLMSACMWFRRSEPVPPPVVEVPPSEYEVALGMLARSDVVGAERLFRQVASSCQNGDDGRRSLLFLSSLWLDQHPQAKPDSAAVLAARYLALPDGDLLGRSMARGVYLLALELGADASLRPARVQAPRSLALRFSDCEQPVPTVAATLPQLDREPLTMTVRRLEAQRDSLAQHLDKVGERSGQLEARVQELEGQLRSAQAEIERIRRLLGRRDTTTVRPRPD